MDGYNLVDTVHTTSRTVIEAELRRLARRAPALGDAELAVVDQALQEVADDLLLDRLRALDNRADELAALFARPAAGAPTAGP